VTVHCNAVPAQDNADADPQTLLAARLSLPFNIALVLVSGDVVSTDLDETTLRDERIRALLTKIRVVSDPRMTRYGARVQLRSRDGRTLERTITDPRGSPTSPLEWDDVAEKFCRLVHRTIGATQQRRVIEAVADIEALDGAAFMQTLRDAVMGSADTIAN
jgi:2-methylcitrate dehydratase PrpD